MIRAQAENLLHHAYDVQLLTFLADVEFHGAQWAAKECGIDAKALSPDDVVCMTDIADKINQGHTDDSWTMVEDGYMAQVIKRVTLADSSYTFHVHVQRDASLEVMCDVYDGPSAKESTFHMHFACKGDGGWRITSRDPTTLKVTGRIRGPFDHPMDKRTAMKLRHALDHASWVVAKGVVMITTLARRHFGKIDQNEIM